MTVLFKLPPVERDRNLLMLEAKPYGSVAIARGDRVFLWWSEAQRGAGLVGHGLCNEADFEGSYWRVAVEVIDDGFRGFGTADLAKWRNSFADLPEATLAAKLYRHSLNKVVAISDTEAAFLDNVMGK